MIRTSIGLSVAAAILAMKRATTGEPDGVWSVKESVMHEAQPGSRK